MVTSVLNFTVRADASQATAELKRASGALTAVGAEARNAGEAFGVTDKNFLRIAKSLGVDLSAGAEKTMNQLMGLEKHLIAIGAPAQDVEKVTKLLDQAVIAYGGSLQSNVQQMGFWQQHGVALAGTASALGGAFLAFGSQAVKAFGESQLVAAQLDAVLKSTGGTAGVTKDQVLALADSLSKVTPFDDEVITRGESLLLTFTNIGKDIFPQATQAMLDMSQALGQDVKQSAIQLGKALQDPVEGVTALKRVGVNLSEAQRDLIKSFVDTGDTLSAQKVILQELAKEFGNSAQAAGTTFPGQLAIAKTAAGNFMEGIGGGLTPTLQGLAAEFPTLTAAAVGFGSTIGSLGISSTDVILAVTSLQMAFGSLGAAMTAIVGTAGPIGLAITGVAALGATIWAAVGAFNAWNEKEIATVNANVNASKATAALTKEAEAYGISLQRGNETQEQFNARLFQAIVQYEKLHPEVKKVQAATEQHAVAGEKMKQVQIDQELLKQAEAARKAQQEYQNLASTFGVKLNVSYDELAKKGPLLLEQMRAHGVSAGEMEVAVLKVKDAMDKQAEAQKTVSQRFFEWRDSGAVALAQLGQVVKGIDSFKAASEGLFGGPEANISPDGTFEAQMQNALKVGEEYRAMMDSIKVETPEAFKPAKQAFGEFAELWKNQVSTIFTDLSKGIADSIIEWKGFGSTMVDIAKEFGKSIIRVFIESLFSPLKTLLENVGKGLANLFSGKGFSLGLGPGAGGTGTGGLGGIFGGLGGILSAGAGIGSGLLGKTFGGGIGGSIGGAALGGLGTFLGGSFAGSAIGAGGGLSSGMAGLTGALGAIPIWGWAALGAAMAAGPLISKFTRRGKEKRTATDAAEELSDVVWNEIVPAVKSGSTTVNEGIDAINKAWSDYENFLRTNLKDQTVIQRSIDGQRLTLTEGLAALQAIQDSGPAAEEIINQSEGVVTKLKGYFEAFQKTGEFTAEFFNQVKELAGIGEANQMADWAAQIQGLQGLRAEFAGLREEIEKLLPKQLSAIETFMETGQITEELAAKINKAGGDISKFQDFANLRDQQKGFQGLQTEFQKTGVISDQLLATLTQFGSPELLTQFLALGNQAKAQGVSILDLANQSTTAAGIIEQVFSTAATGINTAFTSSAQALAAELDSMDERLIKSIERLEQNMIAALNRIIVALGGIPLATDGALAAAEAIVAARAAQQALVPTTTRTEDIAARTANPITAVTAVPTVYETPPAPTTSLSDRQSRYVGSFATGGIVPETGMALVHKGEYISPRGAAVTINATFNNVRDPFEEERMLSRLRQRFIGSLS